MSVKVMTMVWELIDLDQSETLVALALADHANEDGLCWPSMSRVAAKARLSVRQARRVMRRLEQIGIIQTTISYGRPSKDGKEVSTNRFRFNLRLLKEKADMVSGLSRKTGHTEHENRTFGAFKPDIAMSAESPLTIKNHQWEEALDTPEEKIGEVGKAVLARLRRGIKRA